jgi:hypothetical protein
VALRGVTAEYHAQQFERSAADLCLSARIVANEKTGFRTTFFGRTDPRPSLRKNLARLDEN